MTSLRDALEEGFDRLEAEPAETTDLPTDGATPVPDTAAAAPASPETAADEPASTTERTAAERARDESGKFTKEKAAAKAEGAPITPKPAAAVAGKAAAAVVPPAAVAAPVSQVKAPQSWKPAMREKFAGLPPEVQQEVIRRERETAMALQKAAEEAKSSGPLRELMAPYESAIRAQGVEPRQYMQNVLQSAHVIYNGPPEARANALADVIMSAGIPPELLDRALVARMQGGQAPQAQQAQQFRDPRLDSLLAQVQTAQQAREQQTQTEAAQQMSEFIEKHEFGADVAPQVADILDVWAKQGKTSITESDLDRAYTLACQMNPDVSAAFEQRKAAEAAQKAMASTSRSRLAASSVRSQPTAAPAAQPAGRRAVLEAKFDELDG